MIKVEELLKILRIVLYTGNVKNVKPVSLLIVGKSGAGKTELLAHFKKKTTAYVTDCSYSGLLDLMEKNIDLKHVIIPDFIKITQKKRSTSDNFISLLNAVTEEGVGKIMLFNVQRDFSDRVVGLITATTKASFGQHKKIWSSFGFLQRMLIVSYDYNDATNDEIIDYINKETYFDFNKVNLKVNKSVKITSTRELNSQLNKTADRKFRTLKQLQALAKAHALLRNDKEVKQEDIDEIIRLSKFMNLKYTKI